MQDWANRLDLRAQGKPKAASSPRTIRLEGAVARRGDCLVDFSFYLHRNNQKMPLSRLGEAAFFW